MGAADVSTFLAGDITGLDEEEIRNEAMRQVRQRFKDTCI